jgi:Flp pilus assembly protein TadB
MKVLKTTLLLLMGAFLFIQPVGAVISSTHASTTTVEHSSISLKKESKINKFFSKFQKKGSKIDFSDDTGKWLWFAAIVGGVTLILQVFLGASILTSIGWAVTGGCLIVWFLKYMQVI